MTDILASCLRSNFKFEPILKWRTNVFKMSLPDFFLEQFTTSEVDRPAAGKAYLLDLDGPYKLCEH